MLRSFRNSLRFLAVNTAAVLAAVTVLFSVACFSFGASDNPIVYVSETNGNPDVYTVDPESGEASAVERGPASETGPVWSADGKRIAFISDEAGSRDIYVSLVDGQGGVIRITPQDRDAEANEGSPRFKPGGDEGNILAYVSALGGQSDIYVSTIEGDSHTPVTTGEGSEFLGDWSPDGQWLVFSREGSEEVQGLWLRNPKGVNLLRLTEGADSDPVWSPDGDVIAFVRDDFGNRDIYLVRPEEGSEWRGTMTEERWINSPGEDHSPAWSPDGDILAFVTTRDGNEEIYVADAGDDAPPQRLTINEASDTEPVWSPGGDRIAFVTDLFGSTEIMVMDDDGSNQNRLTQNDVRDYSPDW